MSSGASLSTKKLNKENYDTWKFQMETIFIKNDLWEYANGSIIKPKVADEASLWNKKDGKLKEMDIVVTDDLLSILLLYSIPNRGTNYLPQMRLR